VLAYFLLIFLLSSLPLHVKEGPDKILHAIEYGLMGFRRAPSCSPESIQDGGIVLGAATALLFGIFDELHQHFVQVEPPRGTMPWRIGERRPRLAIVRLFGHPALQ
jgi:VanZ family protein